MPRTTRTRVRYDRFGVLLIAVAVVVVSMVGGLSPKEPAYAGTSQSPARSETPAAEWPTAPKSATTGPVARSGAGSGTPARPVGVRPAGTRAATGHAQAAAAPLPAHSGSGRRAVFDQSQQRVWIVGADGQVRRTYLVSGSLSDNLHPGTYRVTDRQRHAIGFGYAGTMQYFVVFAHGTRAAIGFHSIPVKDGKPLQSKRQLGNPQSAGCIREPLADARAMWRFGRLGTKVVVVA